jgi:hypothetical protein
VFSGKDKTSLKFSPPTFSFDPVFAIDSSTIDLCLSVFPWAKFRKAKAAIKLHTMIDAKTSVPEFIYISDGKMHDVKVLDLITFMPDSFYVMDRGYVDFERLRRIHTASTFFITRAKKDSTSNVCIQVLLTKEAGLSVIKP